MSDGAREISLPQPLWDALDMMSKEMGVERDSLVSQAVFTLARLNGYVVPGKVVLGGANPGATFAPGVTGNGQMPAQKAPPAPAPAAKPAPAPLPEKAEKPEKPEKKGKHKPAPEPEPEPPEEEEQGNPFDPQAEEEPPPDEEPAPDEQMAEEEPPPDEEPPQEEEEPEPAPPPPSKKGGGKEVLTVVMAGREPYKLSAESMLIGRGKHCDFVIESNRVSREHARISKEGPEFILEDLNSSNGTFFGPAKDKVTKPRKIKDGDEFTFGTEKVKLRIGR
jgi:hypothetical protein